ncbi:MAG: ABC transporter permease subunit [Burkholderiales bacterium]|nr:ABC transporter permease subunit [Burkholderiales bacterium]
MRRSAWTPSPACGRGSHAGRERAQRVLLAWLALGAAAFVLLPWYFPQNLTLARSLPGVFGGAETAGGLMQALRHGRPWLWCAPIGLALCALAWRLPPGRAQGRWLVAGAAFALVGLVGSGFAIGATGWSFDVLNARWGELHGGQSGIGLGGALVLLALLMLLGAGIARLGFFRGDFFVAGAVVLCSALLLLFVALPVAKALAGAFVGDDGTFSLAALAERLGHERVWGLSCLAGGVRCGTAWDTLFLALLTAFGTTAMGSLIALYAERGAPAHGARLGRTLNVLALLPIITPPFVVGLGLILLFGRAGLFNQFLEWAFGVAPTRWFYGLFGIWLAQLFAFTPIAFMIMRGVVQGIAPSLEEAAQTLHASRAKTFLTVTLPLMKPGLANAFLVGFIESIADFGNPIVVGGQYSVLSTDIFFAIVGAQYDQGRAASLALILTAFALGVFFVQRRVLGRTSYTTVSGKGDAGIAMPLPDGVRRVAVGLAGPWLAFTLVVYLFAFTGGFVQTWGRDYTPTLAHFVTAFDLQWGEHGLVWAGTAWNSLFTTIKLSTIAAPLCAGIGLLIAWLLARTQFVGQQAFEFAALLAFAIPGTVLGVSYILAFNVPPFELTGTGLIIVLCFVFRNLPVGVRAGTASFKQIDRHLDEASTMLRAGTGTTLVRVVLPLLKPALVAALVYSFVRGMTTVSAVIFLVTAENELATTYIIGRVGNGDYGVALAYCTVLIVLMSLATALIQFLVGERKLGRRKAAA